MGMKKHEEISRKMGICVCDKNDHQKINNDESDSFLSDMRMSNVSLKQRSMKKKKRLSTYSLNERVNILNDLISNKSIVSSSDTNSSQNDVETVVIAQISNDNNSNHINVNERKRKRQEME